MGSTAEPEKTATPVLVTELGAATLIVTSYGGTWVVALSGDLDTNGAVIVDQAVQVLKQTVEYAAAQDVAELPPVPRLSAPTQVVLDLTAVALLSAGGVRAPLNPRPSGHPAKGARRFCRSP